MKDKHEFSLGNRDLAMIFAALLLLLVLSFALGVMAGKGMKGVELVRQPLSVVENTAQGSGVTPTAREAAVEPSPTTTGVLPTSSGAAVPSGPTQYTFYETLPKISPQTAKKEVEKPKPSSAEAKGGKYSIQLSSSQDKAQSLRRVEDLKKKGYPAFLEEVEIKGKGTWYRVKVGHFAARDEASRYAVSMRRKEGIPSFVIVSGE